MSRIITIVDALPIGVTSLSITSNSGNNFANADKIITLQLQTDSDDLHDITGSKNVAVSLHEYIFKYT